MPSGKQFVGSLDAGQFWEWFTFGWPSNWLVQWSVRPSPGFLGNVALRALTTERASDGTLTYFLTVWNIGDSPIDFEAWFDFTVMS